MRHKIYIAGPSEWASLADAIGSHVVARLGVDATVVSLWHQDPGDVTKYPADDADRRVRLDINLVGIQLATVVVCLCHVGEPRSTLAEAGYAIALDKPVIWLRGRMPSQRCIFDASPLVTPIDDVPDSVGDMAALIAQAIDAREDRAA